MAAPVGYTCPNIDKIIGAIHRAQKAAQCGKNDTEDSSNWFDTIESELWRLDDSLEDLRNDNCMLRTWGEGCETIIEDLNKEIVDLNEKIEDLERRLEEKNNHTETESLW